jgi:hypothetical protein
MSTLAYMEMADKVNNKLSAGQMLAEPRWQWFRRERLHHEYRRLYPKEHLLMKIRALTALMIACLLISAWAFGFFEG